MCRDLIRIQPVVDEAEIPRLAALSVLALKSDPFYDYWEKHSSGKTFYDVTVDRLTAALKNPNGGGWVFKAVKSKDKHKHTQVEEGEEEDSELVVGVSQWFVGHCETTIPEVPPEQASSEQPDTANPLVEHVRRTRKEYISTIGDRKHVYLRRLFVHPDHQRQGIGRMLLQWGLGVADEQQLAIWLLARPAGLRLYQEHGWKTVSTLEIEPGIPPSLAMIRPPREGQISNFISKETKRSSG